MDSLNKLKNELSNYEWFHDVSRDKYNKVVVYCHYMSGDVLRAVPDHVNNEQILVHFKEKGKEKFVSDLTSHSAPKEEDLSLELLAKELDRLSQTCGWETMNDLLNEIHNEDDAITNFQRVFGTVHKSLKRLYELYGYDVLADELRIT